jgi:hypothetical protein
VKKHELMISVGNLYESLAPNNPACSSPQLSLGLSHILCSYTISVAEEEHGLISV